MAKILKEIWKTFYGSFFETEEECRKAEIHYKTSEVLEKAWNESLKEFVEKDKEKERQYQLDMECYQKRFSREYIESCRNYNRTPPCSPDKPMYCTDRYNLPPKFLGILVNMLDKEGVLAKPELKGESD